MSGSIAAQVFEFCETDLFQETLQNSEVTSSSHCYYDENSSYTAKLSFPSEVDQTEKCNTHPQEPKKFQNDPNENFNASTTTSSSTTTTFNTNSFSIIFDSQDEFDNDISASIDFSTSPPYSGAPYLTLNHQDQLDFSSSQDQLTNNGLSVSQYPDPSIHFMDPPLPCVYEQNCLSMMPPFFRPNPSAPAPAPASYSFFDPSMGSLYENPGIFNGSMLVGSEMQTKDPEYHGESRGMFCQDQLHRVYNSSDTQSISNDNQQVANSVSTSLSTEISNLEDSTFKPGKLSVEQKKEKIRRYMKKRNERNFSKKIKYACRKTLADSRPRVRGRFAKNDELGDAHRHVGSHQEEVVVDHEFDEVRASFFTVTINQQSFVSSANM